jgi:hypothetical protein
VNNWTHGVIKVPDRNEEDAEGWWKNTIGATSKERSRLQTCHATLMFSAWNIRREPALGPQGFALI